MPGELSPRGLWDVGGRERRSEGTRQRKPSAPSPSRGTCRLKATATRRARGARWEPRRGWGGSRRPRRRRARQGGGAACPESPPRPPPPRTLQGAAQNRGASRARRPGAGSRRGPWGTRSLRAGSFCFRAPSEAFSSFTRPRFPLTPRSLPISSAGPSLLPFLPILIPVPPGDSFPPLSLCCFAVSLRLLFPLLPTLETCSSQGCPPGHSCFPRPRGPRSVGVPTTFGVP